MRADCEDDASGSLASVVYDTCAPVSPEKAVDGMPSFAASHAAPLSGTVKGQVLLGSLIMRRYTYTVPDI